MTKPSPNFDAVLEAAAPELRKALEAIFSGNLIHAFDVAVGTNSESGIQTRIVCILAHESAALVLEGTAKGIEQANQLYREQLAKLTDRRPKN